MNLENNKYKMLISGNVMDNYKYQKHEFYKKLEEKERAKRLEEKKKKIQQLLTDAVVETIMRSESLMAEAAADDIKENLDAAFNGGTVKNKFSASAVIAAMIAKLLVTPFNLIDEILDLDNNEH